MNFDELNQRIPQLSSNAMRAAQQRWDDSAKPIGSLGRLEDMVTKLAGIQGTADVHLNKRTAVVFCADNGVLAQGVAQTPGEITAAMAGLIAKKGSAVGLMADAANTDLVTIDIGMFRRVDDPLIRDCHLGNGTQDFTKGPAMTIEQTEKAIQYGIDLAAELKQNGVQIVTAGEMGIGNTTTSSAILSVLLEQDPVKMCGRGVGLTNEGLLRKVGAVRTGIVVNQPDPKNAFDVLQKLGGFDIAGMCGLFLGGAIHQLPIVIDGIISSTAALTAIRLCPNAIQTMYASHLSAEPAAKMAMKALGLQPILTANMRLGEGTGAVALLPIFDLALTVYHNLIDVTLVGHVRD